MTNSKVILLTGSSSGIGEAAALQLARAGHSVYGISRKRQTNPHFTGIIADITKKEQIQKAVDTVFKKEGRIDVLINNAGMGIGGAIEDFSPEEAKRQLETNFFGHLQMIQRVLPIMRKQKSGKIINVSSLAGIFGIPYQGLYTASKFALEGLSESLQIELLPFGIQVVLVEPGDIQTGFTAARSLASASSKGAYKESFQKALSVIEKDETSGLPAEAVGKLLAKVVSKKHPNFRYVVALPSQKLATFLSKILPQRIFFRILGSYYS